jgi:2-hydroxychromene-2-carboxylate isomerase
MKTIDYFYSIRSVYAYFGAARIAALAKSAGRRLRHKPINLAVLIEGLGGVAFDKRPAVYKSYFFGREIERWAEYLGIPTLVEPGHHYGDRNLPSGFVIAAQSQGADVDRLHEAILEALWRFDRDIADPAVLRDLARGCAIDPEPLIAAALAPATQAEFARNSKEAIALGVLGSPTYVVDSDMFYGQDRMMMVERALQRPFARNDAGR